MSPSAPVQPPPPLDVRDLFAAERASLLQLLSQLTGQQWALPTICPGWTVKDVALHLLGVDIGNLSVQRDGFRDGSTMGPDSDDWAGVVDFVNGLNQSWVAAARRISPRLLCELLASTGDAIAAYFHGVDLEAMGERVSWAGPNPSPMWLHVAREYTERWVHQQQIRDAVAVPGFTEPAYMAPVFATFVHALPRTLERASAGPGMRVRLVIGGPAGGRWIALRTADGWALGQDEEHPVAATLTIDQDLAWRLFTRGTTPTQALPQVRIEGDRALGALVLETVSIIA